MDQCPLGDAIQCLEQAHSALFHIFVQNLSEDIGVLLISVIDDTKLDQSPVFPSKTTNQI